MSIKNKKGFTLIELIAVLVILAILALIVTPLVMNIIRKARISADKRSIDAYGRSIEYAISLYLLDNLKYPTSIDQLTIEYSGNQVVCSTTQLNNDSSIYLAGCTVNGRSVEGYTYGKEETITYDTYEIGDEITYNNINYYVIKDTGEDVTLLKAEPLTVAEVNQYGGVGTANNHVNMYNAASSDSYYRTAYNSNGYGGMAYYTSVDCGYVDDSNHTSEGCTSDYAQSEVKYVVDAWAAAKAPAASEARLITINEVVSLGYDNTCIEEGRCEPSANVPTWLYNSNYWYWTMSPNNDLASGVWYVDYNGSLTYGYVSHYGSPVVRPVITLSKSSLSL